MNYAQHTKRYAEQGYTVIRGLYSDSEVQEMLGHYMRMHANQRAAKALDAKTKTDEQDPLKIYPRMMQLHRSDERSRQYLLNEGVRELLVAILGSEPYAASSMFYFKPPKARGQALHQDQYYILASPGTCCAVWIAMDDCDEENGCLRVVPGSHALPLLETVAADTTKSFKNVTVPLPEGMKELPVTLKAGDALIFSGEMIHGSLPNISANRFRRALITHYIPKNAKKVAQFFNPVLRFDGTEVMLESADGPEDDVDL